MPPDLASFYQLIGKIIVWSGTFSVGFVMALLVVIIPLYIGVSINAGLRARRYVRQWQIIKAYVNRQGSDSDELQHALTDALTEGVRAYESTPGKDTVRLDAAMAAFSKAMNYISEASPGAFLFMPDPRLSETAKLPAITDKSP